MALMRSVEEYGLEVPKVPTTVKTTVFAFSFVTLYVCWNHCNPKASTLKNQEA